MNKIRVVLSKTSYFFFLLLAGVCPLAGQIKSEIQNGKTKIPVKTELLNCNADDASDLKKPQIENNLQATGDEHRKTGINSVPDKNLLRPDAQNSIITKEISFDTDKIHPFKIRPPKFWLPGPVVAGKKISPQSSSDETDDAAKNTDDEKFQWKSAIGQSLMFLGIQHGFALATQAKTRHALKGKFFQDYADSVRSLHGWSDGGRFFTNYVAHPMQGSFTGFIFIQNDPKGRKQQFGGSGDYWRSRLKALAWSAAWSTQFEIGPVSQASIGNVGLKGKQTWEDIITTPTVGFGVMITEDAVDRFLIRGIERRSNNFYIKVFSRMLLNPTRTMANLFRLKEPWYRDR